MDIDIGRTRARQAESKRSATLKRAIVIMFAAVAVAAGTATPAAAGPPPDERFRIWNSNSGYCLLTQSPYNNAPVVTWSGCSSQHYADQDWYFEIRGNQNGDYYWIRNANSGKCLLAQSSVTSAVQYTCADYADQHWYLDYDPGNYSRFQLRNRNTSNPPRCLTGRTSPAQTSIFECNQYFQAQFWHL